MNIVVAITGASGAIYARQCIELLLADSQVQHIALILSRHARDVIAAEGVTLPESPRITEYANDDMWSSVASGSANWDAMIVVPASMGTAGRIASGVSQSLIERAADVMLKERRRLVLVVREAPYSLIHLRNLTTITEAGGIIIPASPSFYFEPHDIETLTMTVSTRAVELLGIPVTHRKWGK